MLYNKFQDIELSALGMGTMRLPVTDGCDSDIDFKKTEKMIAYCFEKGINYFDTAWGYHGGNSERVVGEILEKYPRDSFYVATKFPGYDVSKFGHHEEIFKKQLEKLRTDHVDFYLFHNICELNIEQYLDPELSPKEYFKAQKAAGKIGHLGFSTHGTYETTIRFLDAYEECIEFCQIQLNWLDWDFQNAKKLVEELNRRNIPIWVMEPVRGGKLASLNEENTAKLAALRPDESVVGWAFRFLQSVPGVTMILSGMSDMDQLKANIETFQTRKPTTEEEKNTLFEIAKSMTSKDTLPCTGCKYCLSYCPKHLDIPGFISVYNEEMVSGYTFTAPMFVNSFPFERQPANCSHCQTCESVCPQHLKISKMMIKLNDRVRNNPNFK